MKQFLTVVFSDNSQYRIPTMVIALHHAKFYSNYGYDGDVEKCLKEDTLPLFENADEISEWATNNMDWGDLEKHAQLSISPPFPNLDNEWVNAPKGFL